MPFSNIPNEYDQARDTQNETKGKASMFPSCNGAKRNAHAHLDDLNPLSQIEAQQIDPRA